MPKPSLWQGIAETLKDDIAKGCYLAGEKIPTEAALADRFAVNRHTIRRAIEALSADGLLHAKRGSGVFVTAKPTTYPIGKRVRFHDNIHADGHSAGKQILSLQTRRADARERELFGVAGGEQVHVYEGLSLVDQRPIAQSTSIFPATRFADLPAALDRHDSVTKALMDCGLDDYVRSETRVTAGTATPVQANLLRCAVGAALLRTTGINTDLDGAAVELGHTWFVADRVELVLQPET